MKIQSGSVQPGTSVVQQDSNTSVAPKDKNEILRNATNLQLSAQLATSIKSEQSMIATMRTAELKSSLRNVQPNQLREQLESLNNQKNGLKGQIVAKSEEIKAAELAGDQPGIAAAQAQLKQLQTQLAAVDVAIKKILGELEKLQQKQDQEQDRIKPQEEQTNSIDSNLQKAADIYQQISRNTLIKP